MKDHRASLLLGALALAGACVGQRGDPPKSEAKVEATKVEAPAPTAETPAPSKTPPKAEPLTQEELDLIAANPADLPPELRRKRAFALRKKIMQNPDSPAARSLEATREAIERGEIDPQFPARSSDLRLEAKVPAGHPPSSIPDPDQPAPPSEATP